MLGCDSGTVAEYEVFLYLDCICDRAVFVYNGSRNLGESAHVPVVFAVLVGHKRVITGGELLDIQVGCAGAALTECRVTESAGKVRAASENDRVCFARLYLSRDDSVCRAPVRSCDKTLNLCIVKIEVLV